MTFLFIYFWNALSNEVNKTHSDEDLQILRVSGPCRMPVTCAQELHTLCPMTYSHKMDIMYIGMHVLPMHIMYTYACMWTLTCALPTIILSLLFYVHFFTLLFITICLCQLNEVKVIKNKKLINEQTVLGYLDESPLVHSRRHIKPNRQILIKTLELETVIT